MTVGDYAGAARTRTRIPPYPPMRVRALGARGTRTHQRNARACACTHSSGSKE